MIFTYLATNNKDIAPFSFWKYIVINPNKYDETSFIQILEHERIHIIQRHTFDLVLAELFLMVQWFNPLAWWHRHLIDQNLEFLVDQTLLKYFALINSVNFRKWIFSIDFL